MPISIAHHIPWLTPEEVVPTTKMSGSFVKEISSVNRGRAQPRAFSMACILLTTPNLVRAQLSLLAKTAAAAAASNPTATTSTTASKILWPTVGEEPPFWTRWPTEAAAASNGAVVKREGSGEGSEFPVDKDPESIHVVHVTAEMAPLAKVGGLGDVVTGESEQGSGNCRRGVSLNCETRYRQ